MVLGLRTRLGPFRQSKGDHAACSWRGHTPLSQWHLRFLLLSDPAKVKLLAREIVWMDGSLPLHMPVDKGLT
jgi:hypothetical protein